MGLIFALSGWKHSGKDMVAEYLEQVHGFTRSAFADKLKEMVASQYDIDLGSLHDQERKESPILSMPVACRDEYSVMVNSYLFKNFRTQTGEVPTKFEIDGGFMFDDKNSLLYHTPRSLAILEGSTKRCANPNYWVDVVANGLNDGQNHVVPDCRYKNEIETLKNRNPGKVISVRIDRFKSQNSTDSSEVDLNDYKFDYVVNNREYENITPGAVFTQIDNIVLVERNAREFPI